MSAESTTEEERIGRVTVRTTSRAGRQDYRGPALVPLLEIERAALPRKLSRAQLVATLIALFLTLAVGGLGAYVSSGAVMGAAPTPLVALIIAAFIHVRETSRLVVRVGKRELAASSIGAHRRIALERIEGLGTGRDQDQRTIWIRVRGEGRVPLLDALSDEEADLVSRRLREVLDPSISLAPAI